MDGATKVIIWVAGAFVIVCGAVFLLGENEGNNAKKRAECEGQLYAQAVKTKYGSWSSEYQDGLKKCIRTGYFSVP